MTKAQKKDIVRRIKAGETRAAIAADTGFSKNYLRLIWKNYRVLGAASFERGKRGSESKNIPKQKPPTAAQKRKIRRLLESQRRALTAETLRKLVKDELGLSVARKHFLPLLPEWNIPVAPNPPSRRPPDERLKKVWKKEGTLRKKLRGTLEREGKAEWQILGLPRGNRRDGPGPQWRKRKYDREKQSFFYLELWTAAPDSLLTEDSRYLLRRKIYFYSKHLGIDVLSYVIMDSHCFLLVTLPPREKWLERLREPGQLLQCAKQLYQPAQHRHMEEQFAATKNPDHLLDLYLRDFCDLATFVKMVKESVSRAQNRQQNTTGPIWMERYRSLEITDQQELIDCHLRINRWPLTRGLLAPDELTSYPWSSFTELSENSKRAIRATCRAIGVPTIEWRKAYPGDQKKGRKRTACNWFTAQVLEKGSHG